MYASDVKHKSTTLATKLQSLYALNRGAKLEQGFRPQYLRLLEQFGNPHLNLPPTIHIAGTNGKGSTLAFLRAILEAAGHSVHSYTSPHLIEFNERITLAGQKITDAALETLIDEALGHHDGSDISFFEITTAMAFAAFARNPADILLLETGLGGRLDCTNIIESPIATIITPISKDHEEFLGTTLAEIASEKAGIMKHDTPCIIAPQSDPAIESTLKSHAKTKDVQLTQAQKPTLETEGHNQTPTAFTITLQNKKYRYKTPKICGLHQIQNATTAIDTLQVIKDHFPISDTDINTGLQAAHWPARLQNITPHIRLPQGWECWLDGGHNESAAHAIVNQIKNWSKTDTHEKPLHIITGMMPHKDPKKFTEILSPYATSLHQACIPGETNTGKPWQDILNAITNNAITKSRILICGSLYLTGDVLQTLKVKI